MRDAILKFFFLAVCVLGIFGIGGGTERRSASPGADRRTIVIAFTANEKGSHDASVTKAPASAYRTIISYLAHEYPDPLFVHLGNFLGPTPATIISKGKFDFELLDKLGFDLFHPSNHEFTIGAEELGKRVAEAGTPVLTGNISLPNASGTPWKIIQRGGLSIGFIGLTSERFTELVNERARTGTELESLNAYATAAVAAIKDTVDIVVALADIADEEINSIRTIPGIDVLITSSGSSGTDSANWISIGFPGSGASTVLRMIPGRSAMYALELTLVHKSGGWAVDDVSSELYTISDGTPRDKALDTWISRRVETIKSKESEEIGTLEQAVSNDKVREQQNEMGAAVTNLLRSATGADIAVINAGSFRNGLPKGRVTEWDLLEAMPFSNQFVIKRMLGSEIEEVVTKSEELKGKGGYLQWSGLAIDRKGIPGISINGAALIAERKYTVAMVDYLASGGDGYEEFQEAKVVEDVPLTIQDLCLDAFKRYGSIVPPDLRVGRESNYWYGTCRLALGANSVVLNPDNETYYPDQTDLIAEQYVQTKGNANLGLSRIGYWFGFDNTADIEYGINWDKDLNPTTSIDQFKASSQLTFFASHFVTIASLLLDPYASVELDTSLFYPDPFQEDKGESEYEDDEEEFRAGTLNVSSGFQTLLANFFTVKVGYSRRSQPFNPNDEIKHGMEAVLSWSLSLFSDTLTIDSNTNMFSTGDWETDGISTTSENVITFALRSGWNFSTKIQTHYNSIVDKIAYLITTAFEFYWDL